MDRFDEIEIFSFWGKAEKDGSSWHPAVCHMLDVGIVARELLGVLPRNLQSRMCSVFGTFKANGLAFFASLHDIGKISPGFQLKREDIYQTIRNVGFDLPRLSETNHGKIAACCLPDILEEDLNCPSEAALALSQTLAAHHGVFISCNTVLAGGKKWDEARKDTARYLADVFHIDSLQDLPTPSTSDVILFTGLLTLADWLGSSENHFPYVSNRKIDIDEYVKNRTERARSLIRNLQMDSVFADEKTFKKLFPFEPNACQKAVLRVISRLRHPMMVVVETPMGTGKTEAALASYSVIAARNGLRGMYYALPTQATGNAMFQRLKAFLEELNHTGKAEFHLIHANADMNPDYEALKVSGIEEGEGNVIASSWFTARKRGLLANYGTGTIDQALMAILKVKHFFLRLFGLSGKLLVLDEVHAYDAYMTEEITRLVGWLSQCDSSVILLSATLPQSRRQKLVKAFFPEAHLPAEIRYPCVIGIDNGGKVEWTEIQSLDEKAVVLAPLIVAQENKAPQVVNILKEKLATAGCAACILNTVSDAQAVYDAVKREICDTEHVTLFHSRFTLEKRLGIENLILSMYKKGGNRPQKGIVIATQVLEQSLDVDFDFMITDLAPIDLLLQRIGRLHRHNRFRPRLLRDRMVYVLMPDILAGRTDFGGSRYVYFPDMLTRTAMLFVENGVYRPLTISLPHGISPLIETVYGGEDIFLSERMKPVFEKWIEEREGTVLRDIFAAKDAALADVRSCQDDPYYLGILANDNDDERMITTRIGRKTVTLVVVNVGDDIAVRNKEDARRLYARSLVTDNVYLVRHFQDQALPEEWKDVGLLRHCRPVVLRDGKANVGQRTVSYDPEFGLRIIKTGGA